MVLFAGALVTVWVSAPAAQTPATSKPAVPEPSKAVEVKPVPLPQLPPDNPKNPYRDIFEQPKGWPGATFRVMPSTYTYSGEAPRVVCPMTTIPVDPNVDPGIVKVPDLETRHAIRAIKPPCLPD
jgi:hypothetical protein